MPLAARVQDGVDCMLTNSVQSELAACHHHTLFGIQKDTQCCMQMKIASWLIGLGEIVLLLSSSAGCICTLRRHTLICFICM